MFGRYNKVVPPHQQDLIASHRLPRPNWYVGAAEQPASPVDPQLRREIDQIKSDLSGQQGEPVPPPPSADATEPEPAVRDARPAGG